MRRRVFDEPGHAPFLTFACAARRQLLNQDRCKRIVIHHLEAVRAEYDGLCFGFVMMPEHVHALVRFRETGQLSLFKQEWKRRSSISLFDYFKQAGNPIVEHLIRDDGTHRIWTPKQYDFNVFTHEKASEKLQYMHDNPVKRGLATTPEEWALSSARWYSNRRSVGVTLTHIDELRLGWPSLLTPGCVAQETSGRASMKNSALNSIERRTEVSWTCGPRLEASRATPIRMPDAALSFHVEAPGAGAFVIQTSHAMSGPACEPSQVSLSLRDRRRDQLGMPICRFTLSNDGRGTALSLPVAERQGYHPLATAPGLDRQRVCPRPQSSLEITCEIERTEKDSMAKQKVSRPASKGATKSAKKSVVAAKKTPIVKRVVKRGDLWRATELTGDYDQHVLVETALLQKSLTSEAIQMSSTGIRPFNCCQGERQEKTYPLHRVQ